MRRNVQCSGIIGHDIELMRRLHPFLKLHYTREQPSLYWRIDQQIKLDSSELNFSSGLTRDGERRIEFPSFRKAERRDKRNLAGWPPTGIQQNLIPHQDQ